MQRFILLWLALCLTGAACSRSPTDSDSQTKLGPPSGPLAAAAGGSRLADFVVGQPIRHKNLAIFPICSRLPRDEDRFITLDEGLAAGMVEIFEVGADGARIDAAARDAQSEEDQEPPEERSDQQLPAQQPERVAAEVNRLMVLNRSDKPLYLMPGEVIVGGYQDRTIAREGIICSSDKPVPIDAYCVEHGRWSGRGQSQTAVVLLSLAGDAIDEEAVNRLSAQADSGKFVASAGNLGKKGRLAVQADKSQSAVWNQVDLANAMANVQTSSGTFTANYADADVINRIKAYHDELKEQVAEQKQVVGVIVAVNGKVEAVDVFESTPLFKKLWPKLLKSYALDAANVADAKEADKVCTLEAANDFLTTAVEADVEAKTEGEGGLVVTRRSARGVVSFSASEDAEGVPAFRVFGGVHSAAYAAE